MKQTKAEYMREYRRTHPNYDRHHKARQDRYIARLKAGLVGNKIVHKPKTHKEYIRISPIKKRIPDDIQSLKRGVLTHYGGGKLACVICGQDDIDCLSLDHVNNDGHHRTNKHHVGGNNLYKKLMRSNYPEGYQTLCMSCNFKKSLEHLRNNGRSKNIVKDEILPLFKYFEDVALKVKDVTPDDSDPNGMDVINRQDVTRTTEDDSDHDRGLLTSLTSESGDVFYEPTQY